MKLFVFVDVNDDDKIDSLNENKECNHYKFDGKCGLCN